MNPLHTDSTIHIFEKAGLGKAPFQFIGVDIRHYSPAPGIVMVGAACAYCYTGIVECCKIKSADGKQFIVGNECVKKTYDKGLINVCKTALNAERTKARHILEQKKTNQYKCTVCRETPVDALNGFDTCERCLRERI